MFTRLLLYILCSIVFVLKCNNLKTKTEQKIYIFLKMTADKLTIRPTSFSERWDDSIKVILKVGRSVFANLKHHVLVIVCKRPQWLAQIIEVFLAITVKSLYTKRILNNIYAHFENIRHLLPKCLNWLLKFFTKRNNESAPTKGKT